MKNSKEKKAIKNKSNFNSNSSGITLVALVVTIIVLLILAGVALSAVLSQDGIFSRAEQAKTEHRGGTVEEEVLIWKNEKKVAKYEHTEVATRDEIIESQKSRGLLTEDEEKQAKETGKLKIGSKIIDYGEPIKAKINMLPISFDNNNEIDCVAFFIKIEGENNYEINTTDDVISLGFPNTYFAAKNGTYIFNVINKTTKEEENISVKIDGITSNYNLGKQFEIVNIISSPNVGISLKKKNSNEYVKFERAVFNVNNKCQNCNVKEVEGWPVNDGTIFNGQIVEKSMVANEEGGIFILLIDNYIIPATGIYIPAIL